MSTAAQLLTHPFMSVEEYLHTSFDGADREYLDGEVVERNMGNKSHSRTQGRFIILFHPLEATHGLFVVPELRHKVTRTRYRIPDVAVFVDEPADEVPDHPPLVAIEVVSPDDRMGYLLPKLQEYQKWRANSWIADPGTRKLFTYDPKGLREVETLELPQYGIRFTATDGFGK
jgi:Uma2 family endonuclease